MVSEQVRAMSSHWQNWRKTKANLRAQQTLQRPAGAEGPMWNRAPPPNSPSLRMPVEAGSLGFEHHCPFI